MTHRAGNLLLPSGTLLLLCTLAACGTTSGSSRGPANLLTRTEIETSGAVTAYDLVRELRPQFLRSRGVLSMDDPSGGGYAVVYMDEAFRGDLDALRTIVVEDVVEIRYISPADATTRWGTGHAGGVIHVRGR